MSEFETYHPAANFLFFLAVTVFSACVMHPVMLIISFVCSLVYSFMLSPQKAKSFNVKFLLPMMIAAAIINPAFNHEGQTILFYLPTQNPATLESMIYGVESAFMIGSVICWFECMSFVMTSDKLMHIFSHLSPHLSLLFSMTLRFASRFRSHMRCVREAQKCIAEQKHKKGIISKLRYGISIFSAMVTWSLESAVKSADSMKARGYGTGRRSSYKIYFVSGRDVAAIIFTVLVSLYTGYAFISKKISFGCFPSVKYEGGGIYALSVYVLYFMLCSLPIFIELKREISWKFTK